MKKLVVSGIILILLVIAYQTSDYRLTSYKSYNGYSIYLNKTRKLDDNLGKYCSRVTGDTAWSFVVEDSTQGRDGYGRGSFRCLGEIREDYKPYWLEKVEMIQYIDTSTATTTSIGGTLNIRNY